MTDKLFIRLTALCMVILTTWFIFGSGNWQYKALGSDGRGYYAFLPALVVFQDPSFKGSIEAERKAFEHWDTQNYINKTEDNKTYNKCFPGVSVLQTPFFLLGLGVSALIQQDVSGYSDASLFFIVLAGLFFAVLGIWLFYKNLLAFTDDRKTAQWSVALMLFGTFLSFYLLAAPSYSHVYSFFLLNLFIFQFNKIQNHPNVKQFFYLGLILGLIFIVRPTNVLIVLLIPFLGKDFKALQTFFAKVFQQKARRFIAGSFGFISVFSLLLFIWHWQTGQWIVWSYSGEGFNFAHPKIFTTLFSYHIGIFVHTPLFFIACLGIYFWSKKPWLLASWTLYFLVLTYVISSWWSYDYGSSLGHRAFSEHTFLFAYPLTVLIKNIKRNFILWSGLALLSGYTLMRTYQHTSGVFITQRFTPNTFWSSFFDLKKSDQMKYFWLKDTEPHAKYFDKIKLINQPIAFAVHADQEFREITDFDFPIVQRGERYMLDIRFKKKLIEPSENWTNILIVVDGINEKTGERNYRVMPIYNHYKEGSASWHDTHIKWDLYYDHNPVHEMKLYFWNLKQKNFEIKDFEVLLMHAKQE